MEQREFSYIYIHIHFAFSYFHVFLFFEMFPSSLNKTGDMFTLIYFFILFFFFFLFSFSLKFHSLEFAEPCILPLLPLSHAVEQKIEFYMCHICRDNAQLVCYAVKFHNPALRPGLTYQFRLTVTMIRRFLCYSHKWNVIFYSL